MTIWQAIQYIASHDRTNNMYFNCIQNALLYKDVNAILYLFILVFCPVNDKDRIFLNINKDRYFIKIQYFYNVSLKCVALFHTQINTIGMKINIPIFRTHRKDRTLLF